MSTMAKLMEMETTEQNIVALYLSNTINTVKDKNTVFKLKILSSS